METQVLGGTAILAALSIAVVFTGPVTEDVAGSDSPQLQGDVVVEKNGEIVAEVENVMLDGERIIRQQVTGQGASSGEFFNTIALGNGTDTNPYSGTEADLTSDGYRFGYSSGNDDSGVANSGRNIDGSTFGLAPQTGSYYSLEGESQGKWKINKTFTASGSVDVSQTAIEIDGDTAFGDNSNTNTFAATGLGRTIPLESDDELTITWEVNPQNS